MDPTLLTLAVPERRRPAIGIFRYVPIVVALLANENVVVNIQHKATHSFLLGTWNPLGQGHCIAE